MTMKNEDASSSLYALVVVLALCLICTAVLAGVLVLRKGQAGAERDAENRKKLDESLTAWIAAYVEQASSADSRFDEITKFSSHEGCSIVARDASSKINPNWYRFDIFSRPSLAGLLMPGISIDDIESVRDASGFRTDISGTYGHLFVPGALEEYLTPYGFADVNTSDEDSLARLFSLRSGTDAPVDFRNRVKEELRIVSPLTIDDLKGILLSRYEDIFPVISVAPPLNVNFAPKRILEAVLSYPEYGVVDPATRAMLLTSTRDSEKINSDRLLALVGMARENPVYCFLGVKTWFWQVVIVSGKNSLEAIVARYPPGAGHELEADEQPVLKIISRKFAP